MKSMVCETDRVIKTIAGYRCTGVFLMYTLFRGVLSLYACFLDSINKSKFIYPNRPLQLLGSYPWGQPFLIELCTS